MIHNLRSCEASYDRKIVENSADYELPILMQTWPKQWQELGGELVKNELWPPILNLQNVYFVLMIVKVKSCSTKWYGDSLDKGSYWVIILTKEF